MLSILKSAFNHAVAGEVVCIPIPAPIASIFPLPFGLLLQKAVDGNHRISSSGSVLGATDISRFGKDFVRNYQMAGQPFEPVRENEATMSSHLILKHPLEEPQVELISVHILRTMFLCLMKYNVARNCLGMLCYSPFVFCNIHNAIVGIS